MILLAKCLPGDLGNGVFGSGGGGDDGQHSVGRSPCTSPSPTWVFGSLCLKHPLLGSVE